MKSAKKVTNVAAKPSAKKVSKKKGPAKPSAAAVELSPFDVQAARSLAPPVVGIRIYKDTSLHQAWTCYYPRDRKPRSATQAFGVAGDTEAMLHVLRELWAIHLEEHLGTGCPHDFSSIEVLAA